MYKVNRFLSHKIIIRLFYYQVKIIVSNCKFIFSYSKNNFILIGHGQAKIKYVKYIYFVFIYFLVFLYIFDAYMLEFIKKEQTYMRIVL